MHQKKKEKEKRETKKLLAFYFTQMEFSMIEVSRMRRQAEKVAGPWAGHGEMCRLLTPCFPPGICVSG